MKHVKLYENFVSKEEEAPLITIKVQKDGSPSQEARISVTYDIHQAENRMKDLGNAIQSLDPDAMVDIGYSVYNSISSTWMNMISYYPSEERLVHH